MAHALALALGAEELLSGYWARMFPGSLVPLSRRKRGGVTHVPIALLFCVLSALYNYTYHLFKDTGQGGAGADISYEYNHHVHYQEYHGRDLYQIYTVHVACCTVVQ